MNSLLHFIKICPYLTVTAVKNWELHIDLAPKNVLQLQGQKGVLYYEKDTHILGSHFGIRFHDESKKYPKKFAPKN